MEERSVLKRLYVSEGVGRGGRGRHLKSNQQVDGVTYPGVVLWSGP